MRTVSEACSHSAAAGLYSNLYLWVWQQSSDPKSKAKIISFCHFIINRELFVFSRYIHFYCTSKYTLRLGLCSNLWQQSQPFDRMLTAKIISFVILSTKHAFSQFIKLSHSHHC